MITYLEIIFGSKLRLLALVIVLPVVFAGADLYLWRSYTATEVIWVPDPSTYAQNLTYNLGFDPYSTPGQNFGRLFSNLLGAASFNTALLTQLSDGGAIPTARDRSIVSASLNQIQVAPGRATGSSAGGGAAANGDHIVTVKYTCSKKDVCVEVLQAVLNVFVTTYVALKTKAANGSKAIYEAQLVTDEAEVASIQKQIQDFIKAQPKSTHLQQINDPVLTGLQHQQDAAQKAVDADNAQILSVQTLLQALSAMFADVTVIDGPTLQPGLYGINGLGNDNIKTIAIALAGCLVAAVIYVMLVAFMDRTVRDPNALKNRLQVKVIPIADYQERAKPRQRLRNKLPRNRRAA